MPMHDVMCKFGTSLHQTIVSVYVAKVAARWRMTPSDRYANYDNLEFPLGRCGFWVRQDHFGQLGR